MSAAKKAAPQPPMIWTGYTVAEAALSWGVSVGLVRRWIKQDRVVIERKGRSIRILQRERPEPRTRGKAQT